MPTFGLIDKLTSALDHNLAVKRWYQQATHFNKLIHHARKISSAAFGGKQIFCRHCMHARCELSDALRLSNVPGTDEMTEIENQFTHIEHKAINGNYRVRLFGDEFRKRRVNFALDKRKKL